MHWPKTNCHWCLRVLPMISRRLIISFASIKLLNAKNSKMNFDKVQTWHATSILYSGFSAQAYFNHRRCCKQQNWNVKKFNFFFVVNRLTLKFFKGIECNKSFLDHETRKNTPNSFRIAVAKSQSNLLNKCQTVCAKRHKHFEQKAIPIFLTHMPSNNTD